MSDVDPFEPLEGRCNARKSRGVGLCRNTEGFRTDHPGEGQCWLHGGRTENGRKHAAKVRRAREISELMAAERELLGDNPDPNAGVMEVVRWRWAYRRVIEQLVEELLDRQSTDHAGTPVHDGEKPHVLIAMLHEATESHLKACRIAIESGIAERQLRLVEDEAARTAQVLHGVLSELGVIDQPEVPDIVRRHLRLIIGGKAA